MPETRWKRFRQLSLEGLVIVVSVLVALVVEGYRLEREETDEVAEALAARHARLVAITSEIDGSQPFSEYLGRFGGYRVPDLDVSAWARISSDPVANRIAPERLREAFLLYDNLTYLTRMDDQIIQFAFSPGYHDPDEAKVSHRVAEAILSQQIDYAGNLAPLHRAFLEQ